MLLFFLHIFLCYTSACMMGFLDDFKNSEFLLQEAVFFNFYGIHLLILYYYLHCIMLLHSLPLPLTNICCIVERSTEQLPGSGSEAACTLQNIP